MKLPQICYHQATTDDIDGNHDSPLQVTQVDASCIPVQLINILESIHVSPESVQRPFNYQSLNRNFIQ